MHGCSNGCCWIFWTPRTTNLFAHTTEELEVGLCCWRGGNEVPFSQKFQGSFHVLAAPNQRKYGVVCVSMFQFLRQLNSAVPLIQDVYVKFHKCSVWTLQFFNARSLCTNAPPVWMSQLRCPRLCVTARKEVWTRHARAVQLAPFFGVCTPNVLLFHLSTHKSSGWNSASSCVLHFSY